MESDSSSSAEPPSSDCGRGSGEGEESACEQGKLFVGGIPWDAAEEDLRDYFVKYGEVAEVIVMKDRLTGNPRGFGFVSFADPSSADSAIQDASAKHSILGRPVDVKRAKPRGNQQQTRIGHDPDEHGPEKSGTDGAQFSTKKIFVGGLSANLTKDEFKAYFERFGAITDVVVMNDNVTHRPRGFGFVTFESEESVESAVQQTFQTLNGKMVEVKRAVPKDGAPTKGSGKIRTGGPASLGPLMGNGRGSYYQSYPVGLYPAGPRVGLYPPCGYGPGPYGPGYFYGGYGFGYGSGYPSPGYSPERRHLTGYYPFGLNGDLGRGGSQPPPVTSPGEVARGDAETQVQHMTAQLGASSLDDHC